MRKIILDSSVIIKWFKADKEEKIKEATDYLSSFTSGKIQIYIPTIAVYELLNTAQFDVTLPEKQWKLNFKKFFELKLKVITIDEKISQTIYEFGKKNNVSAYDASYVALAKSLRIDFITADQKLVNKVNLPFVKVL